MAHTHIDLFLPIHLPFPKNASQAVFIKTFQAKKQEIKELIEVLSLHCRVFCFPRSALRKNNQQQRKAKHVAKSDRRRRPWQDITDGWDVDIFHSCDWSIAWIIYCLEVDT